MTFPTSFDVRVRPGTAFRCGLEIAQGTASDAEASLTGSYQTLLSATASVAAFGRLGVKARLGSTLALRPWCESSKYGQVMARNTTGVKRLRLARLHARFASSRDKGGSGSRATGAHTKEAGLNATAPIRSVHETFAHVDNAPGDAGPFVVHVEVDDSRALAAADISLSSELRCSAEVRGSRLGAVQGRMEALALEEEEGGFFAVSQPFDRPVK